MNITLKQIGKKFNKHWLFKSIDFTVNPNQTIAITGKNGSGKSTLLQIILGYQSPSVGSVVFTLNEKEITLENRFKHIAFVAPYLELAEELTLAEALAFHFSLKKPSTNFDLSKCIEEAGLKGNEDKHIKYFSSGMKQRLKLLFAFFDSSELLLLDEPTSNLDETGIAWYQQLLISQHHTRTIIIASNQSYECTVCDSVIDLSQFAIR